MKANDKVFAFVGEAAIRFPKKNSRAFFRHLKPNCVCVYPVSLLLAFSIFVWVHVCHRFWRVHNLKQKKRQMRIHYELDCFNQTLFNTLSPFSAQCTPDRATGRAGRVWKPKHRYIRIFHSFSLRLSSILCDFMFLIFYFLLFHFIFSTTAAPALFRSVHVSLLILRDFYRYSFILLCVCACIAFALAPDVVIVAYLFNLYCFWTT